MLWLVDILLMLTEVIKVGIDRQRTFYYKSKEKVAESWRRGQEEIWRERIINHGLLSGRRKHLKLIKWASDIMHIIIDGYNLIRQSDELRRHERISLEDGRKALIRSVSLYKKQKGHRVTVVFDGWQGGPQEEERDKLSGIDVIYSRKGEKADEVIKRIAQERTEEVVVVTSDRGIADFATRRGGTAISSQKFDEVMERAKAATSGHTFHMETRSDKEEDNERDERGKKKGSARKLSRRKKSAMVRIRKL